ncbi:MarR family winged helix-turn-helix transcriptional regulator [Bifidobacterium catulorum]|uniref:MarR family transcriptional regulator n=1 Tax=Bifidobacterium catulorum TaxID=1630173 RepID=A0A2U2MR32_9BIFI|nr:MarR family winged helix-turn-helix transcriptional regulator [Bifidobacterium catulorum]PWG59306.1 MarR family transcriptional regulator [Bifidobacterium catulorum]
MDKRVLSMELRALCKSVDRYLGETMPESAADATGGNAHIIMFLSRNRDRDVYQHTIERKFCITRSTASRVLSLMEKKGLIVREPVAHDARLKKIVLTAKADSIVADLKANGEAMERRLVAGFSEHERNAVYDYVRRMRDNIAEAQRVFETANGRTGAMRHQRHDGAENDAPHNDDPHNDDPHNDDTKPMKKEDDK